jgi:hypothetical protein
MITSRSAIQGQSLLLNSGSIIDTADLEAVPKFFHNCAYLCADEDYVYTIASSICIDGFWIPREIHLLVERS